MKTIVVALANNHFTATFRSEYMADVLKEVSLIEWNKELDQGCQIIDIVTVIDHMAADCLYYQMSVTYFKEGHKIRSAAELAAGAAEAEQNILAAIEAYAVAGILSRQQLTVWETATARAMAKAGKLVQHEDEAGSISGYSLPPVVVGTYVEHATIADWKGEVTAILPGEYGPAYQIKNRFSDYAGKWRTVAQPAPAPYTVTMHGHDRPVQSIGEALDTLAAAGALILSEDRESAAGRLQTAGQISYTVAGGHRAQLRVGPRPAPAGEGRTTEPLEAWQRRALIDLALHTPDEQARGEAELQQLGDQQLIRAAGYHPSIKALAGPQAAYLGGGSATPAPVAPYRRRRNDEPGLQAHRWQADQ